MQSFSSKQASELARVTYKQLLYWDATGLVTPSVAEARGKGSARAYAFRDLVALRTLSQLRQQGVSLQKCRLVAAFLRDAKAIESTADALASSVLLVRDGDVLAVAGERVFSVLNEPGQGVMQIVPIGAIVADIRREAAKLAA